MTSDFLKSVQQCITSGDYTEGLVLIEKCLENQKLKPSPKTEALFWKAYILVQNQLTRFLNFIGKNYHPSRFEHALSIIQELELLNLNMNDHTRLKLLKIKIFRILRLEDEKIALFHDLIEVFNENQREISSKERALFLREKALYSFTQGETDDVIATLKQSLDLSLKIKEYENAAETLYYLIAYRMIPLLAELITENEFLYFESTLVTLQKHQNFHFVGAIFVDLFDLYLMHNMFDRARIMQSKFKDLWQNLEDKLAISLHNWYLMYSGHLLNMEGSYEEAIGIFEKELTLYGETMSIAMKGHVLAYIGNNYLLNSNFKLSFDYLTEAIKICRKNNDTRLETWILFYFIVLSVEMKESDQASQFFERMKSLYIADDPDRHYHTVYQLSEACLLKNSERLRDKMVAQQILEQVVNNDKPIMPDFYYYAVLNYIELLFLEFTSSKDFSILNLIKKELVRRERYIEETQSLVTEAHLNIFMSRILFFELRFDEALQGIRKVKSKAKKQNKVDLILTLTNEEAFLKTEIAEIERLILMEDKPNIDEILKRSQMDELLDELVKYRYSHNQTEVSNYLATALELIQEENYNCN